MLLQFSADISVANKTGRCALSFAAAPSSDGDSGQQRVSQIDIMKRLLESGAKPDRKDSRGKTIRQLVEESADQSETSDDHFRRTEAVQLLAEWEGL